jgi:hypothetical protein
MGLRGSEAVRRHLKNIAGVMARLGIKDTAVESLAQARKLSSSSCAPIRNAPATVR